MSVSFPLTHAAGVSLPLVKETETLDGTPALPQKSDS
jgi:hypothetical protein